jgi:hypothetical protein
MKAYRRAHPDGTDHYLRLRLPLPRDRARRPGTARLGGGTVTMLDDRTPATALSVACSARPGMRRGGPVEGHPHLA